MNFINVIPVITLLFCFGSSDTPLPELDKIIMHDGHFYAVVERGYEIVKLNKQGEIVARTGRRGRGPGEFSTPYLEMTFVGKTLYVLDSMSNRLTLFDKSLNKLEEVFPKDNLRYIMSYKGDAYIYFFDLKTPEDKSIKAIHRAARRSDFKIKSLVSGKVVATYHNKDINPMYDTQEAISNRNMIGLYHPYHNVLRIYKDDSLTTIKLSFLEALALGEKLSLEDSGRAMNLAFNSFPYFPAYYTLIENILLTDNDSIIIQTESYKKGEQIIFYDLETSEISKTIPSPKGRLIGHGSFYFYFYDDNAVKKYSLSELTACSDTHLTFYIDSFEEPCQSCKETFTKIYEQVREYHIPYKLVVEDDNWFGSPDENDYREIVKCMHDWGTWGAFRFEDDCDECFDGGMNVRVNSPDNLISIPASVSAVASKIPCVEE